MHSMYVWTPTLKMLMVSDLLCAGAWCTGHFKPDFVYAKWLTHYSNVMRLRQLLAMSLHSFEEMCLLILPNEPLSFTPPTLPKNRKIPHAFQLLHWYLHLQLVRYRQSSIMMRRNKIYAQNTSCCNDSSVENENRAQKYVDANSIR